MCLRTLERCGRGGTSCNPTRVACADVVVRVAAAYSKGDSIVAAMEVMRHDTIVDAGASRRACCACLGLALEAQNVGKFVGMLVGGGILRQIKETEGRPLKIGSGSVGTGVPKKGGWKRMPISGVPASAAGAATCPCHRFPVLLCHRCCRSCLLPHRCFCPQVCVLMLAAFGGAPSEVPAKAARVKKAATPAGPRLPSVRLVLGGHCRRCAAAGNCSCEAC
mmetsp:Transcript_6612/g.14366  ORF Transcript_6612/g.14366 Transcript_6612/m.14366 type:complete len:221 (+) Transcript_6612:221-883(+)